MSYFNPQRRPLIAFTILVFIPFGFSCQLAVCAQPPADSQWLQYRRDPTLTGRSPLSGQITTPTIKWKYECSMRQGFFRLDLDAFPVANLNVPPQELNPDHCQSIAEAWGMGTTWYQLEDEGKFPQPGPHHSNIGYFLPAQSGLQQLIFDTAFEVRSDERLPLHDRFLIRRAGQAQRSAGRPLLCPACMWLIRLWPISMPMDNRR